MAEIMFRKGVMPPAFCAEIIGMYSGFMTKASVGKGSRKTYRSGRKAMSHEMKPSLQLSAYTLGLAHQCSPDYEGELLPMQCDLICYSEGDSFTRHKDAAEKEFTCIYFFNEGYEGGDLVFDNGTRISNPTVGSACIWRNTKDSYHQVEEVTKGKRFVLAHWLKAKR